jgi:hypothetical protein
MLLKFNQNIDTFRKSVFVSLNDSRDTDLINIKK